MKEHEVAVIGAGPAGVAMAVSLKDRGLHPLLIEQAECVGAAWRGRYDRLKLNTGRPFSHLPNRRYPKGTAMFPHRDDVVAHLDRHAREEGIERRLGTRVDRIERRPGGWRLLTSTGVIDTKHVVVANGNQHTPRIPDWRGVSDSTVEMLHSSAYRNPGPFQGKDVLVVGSGSSGMEIAHDLATGGAGKVWLAVRTPPHIMWRTLPGGFSGDVFSRPLYRAPTRIADAIARKARMKSVGDLSEFGLPIPAEGMFTRVKRLGVAPTLVDREVIDAVKTGAIDVVAAVDWFEGDKVVLADGTRLAPDVVVSATGYRRGLEQLVGHLGVLDANGGPSVQNERAAAAGLRFIGFQSRPSLIGYVGKKSKRVAKRIARELSAA